MLRVECWVWGVGLGVQMQEQSPSVLPAGAEECWDVGTRILLPKDYTLIVALAEPL